MADDRRAAGPILGSVGGFVILVYGAYELYLATAAASVLAPSGLAPGLLAVAAGGVAGVVLGSLVLLCSALVWWAPDWHALLGFLVILFSVLSLASLGGGEGVGLLLGVIGGTCSIVFGPEDEPYAPRTGPGSSSPYEVPRESPPEAFGAAGDLSRGASPQAPSVATYRGCAQCGSVAPGDAGFCPQCGRPL